MLNFQLIYICGIVFFAAIIFNLLLLKYSKNLKLIDIPNERSMHQNPKSRAGGIAIIFTLILGIILTDIKIELYLISGFFIIFILGIFDDIFTLKSKTKFIFIAFVALLLFYNDFGIYNLGKFLGQEVLLNKYLALPFFVIAIVGFINAMNLIDGLDGLSSGIAIIILLAFSYIGYKYQDMFLFYISSFLIISLSAFLLFNWYPSKMFMGDSGSLSLGFIISVLAIDCVHKEYFSPVTILLLTALPILDTLIVMLRRIKQKKNPFKPDKTHIHHLVLKIQRKNVRRTTLILILLQAIFTYIGLGFKVRDDILILIIFILLLTFFYMIFTPTYINKKIKQK